MPRTAGSRRARRGVARAAHGSPRRGPSGGPSGRRTGSRPGAGRPSCGRAPRSARRGRSGGRPGRACASRARPGPASRGTRRGPCHMPGGCAGTRRGRRGSPGTARGRPRRSRLARRPRPRGRRPAGASGPRGTAAAPAAPAAAARRAPSAAGFGSPPAIRRPGSRESPASGTVAPQPRQRAGVVGCPHERPAVRLVDRAERLARRREAARRVARAAPEDGSGPARPAGDELALAARRARHLERQLGRAAAGRPLDVVALRVAVAADERPEAAALRGQDAAVGRAARRARPRRRPAGPAPPAPRPAAAATPCARGRASRRGSARCARAGSPSGGRASRPRRSPRS